MKKLLLFLCIIVFPIQGKSQNTFIKEFRYQQKVTIADGAPASPNAGPIIKRLAEGNNKPPRSTSFIIEFEQIIRLNTREPNFVYRIDNSKLRLSGDIRYKSFDVSDLLIPVQLKFELRLKRPNGTIRSEYQTALINNEQPEATGFTNTDSADRSFVSFEPVNPVFQFDNTNSFESRIKLINDYYKAIRDMDEGFAVLQSVTPENLDAFRQNQKNLATAESIFQDITSFPYESRLSLQIIDPGRYLNKKAAFRDLLLRKKQDMEIVWSTLHLKFFERGLNQIKKGNYLRAEELFLWSLEVNPGFSPALLQLAILDYTNGHLLESMCKADDILFNMPADPQTRSTTIQLVRDIYGSYIQAGNDEIRKKNYAKALDQFESATRICKKYHEVKCDDNLYNGISAAKTGIYTEILDEARDFIVLNDLDRAENSAIHALNYQQENRNDVHDAMQGNTLLKSIRQKKYDAQIQKGIRYTDQRMYEHALQAFDDADSLQATYELSESKNIGNTILMAARPRAIELLYEGEAFVKNNQLTAARSAYRSSMDIQQKYGITSEKDILKHSEALRKAIFTQQCQNAQNEIDNDYNTGQRLEVESDFLGASAAYKHALSVKSANADCDCQTDSIESSLNAIRPAATYLELMNASKESEQRGNYQMAIDYYDNASKYFAEKHIGTYGLDHQPDLYLYIREKGSNGLINYSGDYYRERGELDKSLALYKLLLDRHYDRKLIDGSLYKLGLKLGQRDKPLNPSASWKDLVEQYVGGDKSLKKLRAGYKAGFR
ncbi:MAG: hypothetical protein U0Y08_03095 [Bacteroidia bacterium]